MPGPNEGPGERRGLIVCRVIEGQDRSQGGTKGVEEEEGGGGLQLTEEAGSLLHLGAQLHVAGLGAVGEQLALLGLAVVDEEMAVVHEVPGGAQGARTLAHQHVISRHSF